MIDKENNIIYSAQDIEQYLAGKLTPLQMHAIEKAALDDPFLAEAIDGYEGMKPEQWKTELTALKNEFINKQGPAKIIPLSTYKNNWWKYAAAVLLIGSAATLSYKFLKKKDKQDIAQTVQPTKKEITSVTDTSSKIRSTPAEANVATTSPQQKTSIEDHKNSNTIVAKNDERVREDEKRVAIQDSSAISQQFYADAQPAARKNTGDVVADKIIDNKASVAPAASATNSGLTTNRTNSPITIANANTRTLKKDGEAKYNNNNGNLGYSNQAQFERAKTLKDKDGADVFMKEPQLNRNFIAQVVGPDNTPLPFANISIKSENFGTYADVKGNFRLVSNDSLLTVEVKAAGYQPRFYTLQSMLQQNKIILAEEDAAVSYKAVSGNASSTKAKISRRAALLKDSLVNVEPADGWDNYSTYVDNNIEIPDDIVNKNIHGQVALSFDVKSNGTITNIKVDKSLCNNCDEVAKRLIEQGPQWKVKKGKKGKGKITVQF